MLHALTLSCDECKIEETLERLNLARGWTAWRTGTWIMLDLPMRTSGETFHFCGYKCLALHASRAARRQVAAKRQAGQEVAPA